jgi:hypothetical protein
MIESTEEERLFGSCSINEAGAYKMLIRKPEEKRSFYGSRSKYVDKCGINFDRECSEPAGCTEMMKNRNPVPVIPKHSNEASSSVALSLNKDQNVN